MAVEKLEINYKPQNKTWTNPQIKNNKNCCELRLIRPQTQHRNPDHTYLNT
jgi:hypothetical protein